MNTPVVVCGNNTLDTISNVLTLIVGIINLAFIIYVYLRDKKENKEKEISKAQLEKEKQELEYKYNWYKMINVSDRINALNKLLSMTKDAYNNIINCEDDSLEYRKQMMNEETLKINMLFVSEKNNYTHVLKSLDNNENIELTKLYNEFQELYLNVLESAVLKKRADYSNLHMCLSKIVAKYYDLGHDILLNKKA